MSNNNVLNDYDVNDLSNQIKLLKNIDWFHGIISRKDAEKKISMNGDFLIRLSNENENQFVLSTKWNGKYMHFIVKNEFDVHNKCLNYYFLPKLKFRSIEELINIHMEQRHPVSSSSDAQLCQSISASGVYKKEHKFRKSMRVFSKKPDKSLPRSGSVVTLETQCRMSTFSEINKSLTELSTTTLEEPTKSSKKNFHSFANKIFQPRLRSTKVNNRNEKSKIESGGLFDNREHYCRGRSLDAMISTLINDDNGKSKSTKNDDSSVYVPRKSIPNNDDADLIETLTKDVQSVVITTNRISNGDTTNNKDKSSLPKEETSTFAVPWTTADDPDSLDDPSVCVVPNIISDADTSNDTCKSHPLKRGHSSIYVVPQVIEKEAQVTGNLDQGGHSSATKSRPLRRAGSSIYVVPLTGSDNSAKTDSISRNESLYVVPLLSSVNDRRSSPRQSSLTMRAFINFDLSTVTVDWCRPMDSASISANIRRVSALLLSDGDHCMSLSRCLIEETRRIFSLISTGLGGCRPGYRWLFLAESAPCQRDLLLRQTTLTSFVMATIVTATCTDQQIRLLVFWIRCAEDLLVRTRDMFHCRSVVTAIFSDQISGLNAWKSLYVSEPSMIRVMQRLRGAISDGCFTWTAIENCVPDIVQLYGIFTSNEFEDDFQLFVRVCLDVLCWKDQSFDGTTTWLTRIQSGMDDNVTSMEFLRELVQTETLLCLTVGRRNVNPVEVEPLLYKFDQRIVSMADET